MFGRGYLPSWPPFLPRTPRTLRTILHNRSIMGISLDQTGPLQCALEGKAVLASPQFNKGTAFSKEERRTFKLAGLLPSRINDLELQAHRAYGQYESYSSDILKNSFLQSMNDQNQVLFYKLLSDHLKEMMPIIYTPTEGDAIMAYSKLFRRPEACFLNIEDSDETKERLRAWGDPEDIDYIVVTDGEEILGIGDQGAQGVGISQAKLVLMTLCAGINPNRTLPVILDVGTENEELLNSDLYLGLKRRRATGKEYDDYLEVFVHAVQEMFPMAMLHFEDFGLPNARRLLEKYQPKLACFNDDIQGTGCVTQAAIKAATWITKENMGDQKIVIFGAGTAGTGIADQLRDMIALDSGKSKEEATKQIYLIDKLGLCVKGQGEKLTSAQIPFAREDHDVPCDGKCDLLAVVKHVKPNILIGTSTVPGAFTEEIIREMAKHVDRPIIFPLSNPTRLHEALPKDISAWTDGRALIATGSPFQPVTYNGKEFEIAECNNCLVYPGIGLGCVLSRAERCTDEMIVAAAHGAAELSPALKDPEAALLPDITDVRETSVNVAVNVIQQAVKEGLNRVKDIPTDEAELKKWVENQMWKPVYRHLEKVPEHVATKEAKGELGVKSRA